MKTGLRILLSVLVAFAITGCKDHIPQVEDLPQAAIDFAYEVADDTYQLDYYVGATIKFYPTVKLDTDCTWDFGDGTEKVVGDTVLHKFTDYGTFKVSATANGATKTNVIYVSDIIPIVTLVQEDPLCEVGKSYIHFKVELPNPDNLEAVYQWTFPEGTTNEQGDTVASFTGTAEELGKVKFARAGSQTVRLQVVLGGRNLTLVRKNVQVALSEPAQTLYYAVKEGNLMSIKIPSQPIEGVTIDPYDMGISAGQHCFNILFNEGKLYMLDAGKQFNYINDENGVMGDGKITVVSPDATVVETMVSNVGGPAFQDPFYGYFENGKLYYSDRNTGMIEIDASVRNEVYSIDKCPYFVQNNYLGYYGHGLSYGAITSQFGKIGDTYYWAKTFNGEGIFRFTREDILKEPDAKAEPPKAGRVLSEFRPKAFVYDEQNQLFYFALIDIAEGFYSCQLSDLDLMKSANVGSGKTYAPITFADGSGCPQIIEQGKGEGSAGEYIGICQMALDKQTGDVYFGLRSADANVPSGLVRYNAATKQLEYLVEGVQVYGVAINETPSKLF